MNKITTFIKESKKEFDRVDWPDGKQTVRYTLFVIAITIALAALLGGLDYIFVGLLERLVL